MIKIQDDDLSRFPDLADSPFQERVDAQAFDLHSNSTQVHSISRLTPPEGRDFTA